jgi:hypothetical protein
MEHNLNDLLARAGYLCMHCKQKFTPPAKMMAIVTESYYVPLCIRCFQRYEREGVPNHVKIDETQIQLQGWE